MTINVTIQTEEGNTLEIGQLYPLPNGRYGYALDYYTSGVFEQEIVVIQYAEHGEPIDEYDQWAVASVLPKVIEDFTATTQTSGSIERALVDLRDRTIQKARIAMGNRLSAMERGDDDPAYADMIERWHTTFEHLEKELDDDIRTLADDMPIVQRMIAVKGVGELLAVKVAAMIDIERADTVSALWKYAGYGVTNGERDRLQKGEKSPYNKRLKTTCYLVATSFMRANSPYRQIYDDARDHYETARPEWTKGHKDNAAKRKMIKMWLSHLWQVWREMEGLPVTEPYIMGTNGHHHLRTPEEFGW